MQLISFVRRRTERGDLMSRPDHTPDAELPVHPVIEFEAYTSNGRIRGDFSLSADRLTDELNRQPTIVLIDAIEEPFDAPEPTQSSVLIVARDDLFVVRATGPVGSPARRYRTTPYEVSVRVGPYHLEGLIHAGPGAHPTLGIYHRRPMIPITEASLAYEVHGRSLMLASGAFIVHRDRIASIGLTRDAFAEREPAKRANP
jgi:hypothetical protein